MCADFAPRVLLVDDEPILNKTLSMVDAMSKIFKLPVDKLRQLRGLRTE
jgi:hypothetical protein